MDIAARADGSILWAIGERMGDPPPELESAAAERITLDETTNAAIAAQLQSDPGGFRLLGSTLTRDGAPVTINPPGPAAIERADLDNLIAKLSGGTSLTTTETRRAWLYVLRDARERRA